MTRTRRLSALVVAILVAAIFGGYAVGASALSPQGLPQASSDDYQDDIDATERERRAAERRAEQLEHELENTDARIVEADEELRALEGELPALEEQLEDAERRVEAAIIEQGIVQDKLDSAEAQDRAISEQIAEDEERTASLEALVAAIARETYKGNDNSAGLAIVFGSSDTQDFVDEYTAQQSATRVQSNALGELEEIAAVNRNRGARQDAVREYIGELKAEIDALVIQLDEAREVAQEARDEVQALLDEQEELRAYLESQRAAFVAQQEENEALQQQLRNEVLTLYSKKREAEEQEAERARKRAEANNSKPSSGLTKGSLAFPTKVPYKTSSFGMRQHPIYNYMRLHAGTDLRAYCGTPIYASAAGTVEWATYKPGYGNQVLIDHGIIGGKSVITNYNHFSRFAVGGGQRVARGDLIGYSGSTGSSTACHLHFEVYVSGSVVNPETLLPNFP
ncbi:peptidoglycan DD-metalloendopeptidase family protein [Demequina muriae]|uniref:Peptidoglycan DD-metalloendopeptidase family protein n=1 Tax=Demequina muriae TaxID=3051664 RepID=A0ABT8GF35_9MICO|nr:M23 family metallopeptidase [Demequina sp. EGI L300058]MDN4479884.1 peptidoglycan DD-metalloendopeptidase family protein [Demequina sp. EGI L300058]